MTCLAHCPRATVAPLALYVPSTLVQPTRIASSQGFREHVKAEPNGSLEPKWDTSRSKSTSPRNGYIFLSLPGANLVLADLLWVAHVC